MSPYKPDRVWHANASIQKPVYDLFVKMDDTCFKTCLQEVPFMPFVFDRTNRLVNTLKSDLRQKETTHEQTTQRG